MYGRKKKGFDISEITDFLNQLMAEKSLLPFAIAVLLGFWTIDKWIFSLASWVPLLVAVWATVQHGSHQRRIIVEDLNKRWMQLILHTTPVTPLEHCEWLNKLLMEVWANYINPKLSIRFSSIVEKRLKHRKPRFIERIELVEFSLGSSPPRLGIHGTHWLTSGDQRIMRLGFDWDATDMSIMLLAKLAKPLMRTAKIVINSIHINGDLLLLPILDGKAVLYSFVSTPEVRVSVAFGSGSSQSLPATELPGVSTWLVKLLTDTLVKTMVEPRRRCFALPSVDLRKKAVGGILYVTIISANNICRNSSKSSSSRRQQGQALDNCSLDDDKDLPIFVEVELEHLTRRTHEIFGLNPTWDSTFNMVLHDNTGILKFSLYESTPGNIHCNCLTSCEIKVRYVADDSTIFWAFGAESRVIAKHVEFCGKEVEMVVPFEGVDSGELKVRLELKEWQFADGSHSLNSNHLSSRGSPSGSSVFQSRTGRKIYITVVEGKDLMVKDKTGKPYVKLQYGKGIQRTKSAQHTPNPIWNQKFEIDEMGHDEYLKIKCYSEETFSDDNIGGARVNLEGLLDGSVRDVWVPLEKANSGELRLQIEALLIETDEVTCGYANGWIELVLVEGRDLVAADIRGTSDPYVKIQYGSMKRRSKVIYKTLNPQWHQTFEFRNDGSLLALQVKDHNALLPGSSIGDCIVEYQRLSPNVMSEKWIPLQGVKKGEIHVQVTRKVPELQKKASSESSSSKGHQISSQMKQMMLKFRSLIEDGNLEEVSAYLSELESLHDVEEECILQLEREQTLLLDKISQLGQEIFNASPSLGRRSSSA